MRQPDMFRTPKKPSEGLPPEAANRAVREYLAVLDEEAFGAATEVTPKYLSLSDPASRWTAAQAGPASFTYCTNYLIDLDHAVIVDVEPSTAVRQGELAACRTMVERVKDSLGLWPERLAADTAYGTAEMLQWLVHDQGIEPHIPVFDKSKREDGTFSRDDFAYDPEADAYTLSGGQAAEAQPASLQGPAHRASEGGHDPLSRQHPRLQRLRPEAQVLPRPTAPKGPSLDLRGRAGHGPRHRQDRRLLHLQARAEEGGAMGEGG